MVLKPAAELSSTYGERTINELLLMFKNRQINLEPGFQRKSVWSTADRMRLVQSIVSNYPLPSIFLYKRTINGRLVYDVIDGKQRLETILMFMQDRHFHDHFDAKLDLGFGEERYGWKDICRRFPNVRAAFTSYKLQTAEVAGELSTIIDLFVRINSTGKRLTGGEKRHARFYNSAFLKEAERLVGRFRKYVLAERILSQTQLDRMKGTELFSELLMSIHHGGLINKKTALDRAIGNDGINKNTLGRISREFTGTINSLKKVFPDIRKTRFHNTADYYSLFLLVWEMRDHKFVLSDRKRNRIAQTLLLRLSTGVDELRLQLRAARPARPSQRLFADYLLTVQGDTDSGANRQRRAEILRGLLGSLFIRKDEKRIFSSEQRRILWNSDEKQYCRKCHKQLTWENFTIDHKIAHNKGGRTILDNAQLLCRSCNSKKGAR
jgi:hypothetical protein